MAADLRVIETDRAACRGDAIRVLEDMLAEARAGNMIAVGVAVVRPDGAINSFWSRSDNIALLAGSTALLHHRLLSRITE